MTTMISEVYDALKEAGASEEKAKAAASALASYESNFSRIDSRLEKIETKLDMIKWVLGLVFAGIIALIIKSFL